MNFILENYLIIVLVGLFFVFALIGYLIDMLRKSNDIKKDEVPNINPVEIYIVLCAPELSIGSFIISPFTTITLDVPPSKLAALYAP